MAVTARKLVLFLKAQLDRLPACTCTHTSLLAHSLSTNGLLTGLGHKTGMLFIAFINKAGALVFCQLTAEQDKQTSYCWIMILLSGGCPQDLWQSLQQLEKLKCFKRRRALLKRWLTGNETFLLLRFKERTFHLGFSWSLSLLNGFASHCWEIQR